MGETHGADLLVMAGMSSLSDRYREDASIAESLNQAALAIKKESLGIRGDTARDETDLKTMREFVLLVSGALLVSQDASTASASPYLPRGFSDEDLASAKAMSGDIQGLRDRLIHDQPLETSDFRTLDRLVELTGEATSRSFRAFTRG
jgi:hypothetical protein